MQPEPVSEVELPPGADPAGVHYPRCKKGQIFASDDGTAYRLLNVLPRRTWNAQIEWACMVTTPSSPEPMDWEIRESHLGEPYGKGPRTWNTLIAENRQKFDAAEAAKAHAAFRRKVIRVDLSDGVSVALNLETARYIAEEYGRLKAHEERRQARRERRDLKTRQEPNGP